MALPVLLHASGFSPELLAPCGRNLLEVAGRRNRAPSGWRAGLSRFFVVVVAEGF